MMYDEMQHFVPEYAVNTFVRRLSMPTHRFSQGWSPCLVWILPLANLLLHVWTTPLH